MVMLADDGLPGHYLLTLRCLKGPKPCWQGAAPGARDWPHTLTPGHTRLCVDEMLAPDGWISNAGGSEAPASPGAKSQAPRR